MADEETREVIRVDPLTGLSPVPQGYGDSYLRGATRKANDAIRKAIDSKDPEDMSLAATEMRSAADRLQEHLDNSDLKVVRSEKTRQTWAAWKKLFDTQATKIELGVTPVQGQKRQGVTPQAELPQTSSPPSHSMPITPRRSAPVVPDTPYGHDMRAVKRPPKGMPRPPFQRN